MHYLDAAALARLRNLRFELRRIRAEGQAEGRHRSSQRASSQEFSQYRQYVPGDELKHLDWKVYARQDRYFVKQSQEDKNLRTYLLVDSSGSMAYRGAGLETKFLQACRLAAGMACLIMTGADAVGLVTFDVSPRVVLPPREQLPHLELIDAALARAVPGGETDLGAVLARVAALMPRRSLVLLVSDLLGDAARILEVVKAMRARKHQVLVLRVLDPTERDLELEGPVRFESLEDGSELLCEAAMIRGAYREGFERQQRLYQGGFHRSGIPFATVYTDSRWDENLRRFLALQSSLRWSPS